MTSIADTTIQSWNQQGFIPGPDETEQAFIERVEYCQNLKQTLFASVNEAFPFASSDEASQGILESAYLKTKALYDIEPTWVPLFLNNYQLAFWHGGCAWIFQISDQTPTAAFLQLRANFRTQSTYLGLYKRDELIAHEVAHVGRMMFQEPQFEEILAYRSSDSRWRRWMGPIVQTSNETLFFMLIVGFVFLAELAVINLKSSFLVSPFILGLALIPVLLFSLAFSRLALRQWQFYRCLKNLTAIYQDQVTAQWVIYRLLDKEIHLFASSSPDKIRAMMTDFSSHSFRWQFILQNYPLPY